MLRFDSTIRDVLSNLERAPGAVRGQVLLALDRAALEVSREMRRAAPKAFTTLTNSIHIARPADFERVIAPGVNYAEAVEEGTGPAAGKARYFPRREALIPWLKLRAGVRLGATKPGSAARQRQGDQLRDRSFALARHIHKYGTRPQPFVAPVAQKMESRVMQLLTEAVHLGLGGRSAASEPT